jgi:acetyl esterase
MAEWPQITPELWALMAEVGPRWLTDTKGHVALMSDEFAKIHRTRPFTGVVPHRDLSYGPHERHQLDVWTPEAPGTARPAVIFVHGGGFTDGQRNRSPEFYSNILAYFARHGIVGINISYRLAPEAVFPGGTQDTAAAVAWVKDQAAEYGIDPDRIFLMGHSAGGAHVASYAYDHRLQPPGGPGLAGLIVVSGRVRADNLPENTNARRVEAYYGDDSTLYDDVSPVMHVSRDSPPTFVGWSEYENALIDVYCTELVWRLGHANRRSPPSIYLPGHNHTSIVASIGTDEDRLGSALLKFIADPRR